MSDMKNASDIPFRIATYCRVSTKSQGGGIETQRLEIDKYIARMDWPTPVLTYEDQMTARKDPRKDPRPGHNRMKLDAMTRQFDTLIVWRLDRLARSAKNAAEWYDICTAANIRLVLVGDGMIVDHTPMGKMMFSMMGVMAAFFADMNQANREAGQARYWAREDRDKGGRPRKYKHRDVAAYYEKHTEEETRTRYGIGKTQLRVVLRKELVPVRSPSQDLEMARLRVQREGDFVSRPRKEDEND
jgi:DNA invertase Pin-like site-specific DNA recombinase